MAGSLYKGFTDGQSAYLKRSLECWLNVAEGGKRAGKNVLNIIGFGMHVEKSPDKLHLVAGVTTAAARLNIVDCNGFGLKYFFGNRVREGRYEGKAALFVDGALGERVILIEGGQRASDATRIKGMSLGSAYITEANEVAKSFFFEVLDRTLAARARKIFVDINAKMPNHWFYKEFLDRQEALAKAGQNPGYNYGHFTIMDNLGVPNNRIKALMQNYDPASNWFLTEIMGKRGGGGDIIYAGFGMDNIAGGELIAGMTFVKLAVGIDVGGRDATCATLVGVSGCNKLVLIDGYYHKQGSGSGMTHDRYVKEIVQRMNGWFEAYPGLRYGGAVFCESAEKLFRQALQDELRRAGHMINVYPSYKKDGVLERIRLFSMLIVQGRLLVARHMDEWIGAFYQAIWDDKARAKGVLMRVDDGSYAVDCLDSAEYGAMPFKSVLIKAR